MYCQQSVILKNLLTKQNGEFARKYGKFVKNNNIKSVAITKANYKLSRLVGIIVFKKFMKEFPKLFVIGNQKLKLNVYFLYRILYFRFRQII